MFSAESSQDNVQSINSCMHIEYETNLNERCIQLKQGSLTAAKVVKTVRVKKAAACLQSDHIDSAVSIPKRGRGRPSRKSKLLIEQTLVEQPHQVRKRLESVCISADKEAHVQCDESPSISYTGSAMKIDINQPADLCLQPERIEELEKKNKRERSVYTDKRLIESMQKVLVDQYFNSSLDSSVNIMSENLSNQDQMNCNNNCESPQCVEPIGSVEGPAHAGEILYEIDTLSRSSGLISQSNMCLASRERSVATQGVEKKTTESSAANEESDSIEVSSSRAPEPSAGAAIAVAQPEGALSLKNGTEVSVLNENTHKSKPRASRLKDVNNEVVYIESENFVLYDRKCRANTNTPSGSIVCSPSDVKKSSPFRVEECIKLCLERVLGDYDLVGPELDMKLLVNIVMSTNEKLTRVFTKELKCSTCGETKLYTDFPESNTALNGRLKSCKECKQKK